MGEFLIFLFLPIVVVFIAAFVLDSPNKQGAAPEPKPWQKVVFVIWVMAGPLYLLWDWGNHVDVGTYKSKSLGPDELRNFQSRQKLLGDVWTASAVLFVVFWGVKKLSSLMGIARAEPQRLVGQWYWSAKCPTCGETTAHAPESGKAEVTMTCPKGHQFSAQTKDLLLFERGAQ